MSLSVLVQLNVVDSTSGNIGIRIRRGEENEKFVLGEAGEERIWLRSRKLKKITLKKKNYKIF
jgi:hypothetical protein